MAAETTSESAIPQTQQRDWLTPLQRQADRRLGLSSVARPSNIDYDGHGSHTASTTAGNFVAATHRCEAGRMRVNHDISGVAPHANIIAYRGSATGNGCPSRAPLQRSIRRFADGVDVINFSVGASSA